MSWTSLFVVCFLGDLARLSGLDGFVVLMCLEGMRGNPLEEENSDYFGDLNVVVAYAGRVFEGHDVGLLMRNVCVTLPMIVSPMWYVK
ncbi:hypothetical protein O9G_003095 [Rozella allomycis CSF55]|uniref:Uncharacterized protein n=1 Tax=Rozella allomycis (strain CSF55) TaxID=988480 RepID=A0A075AX67_ROZAC|nr:hypothetical protein O9G_003095 [Rozella allomycis CSF55]|eukprot:EPZ33099.1 hypothetical protein O9G_003095 [Rozella allomycis CSF55]